MVDKLTNHLAMAHNDGQNGPEHLHFNRQP